MKRNWLIKHTLTGVLLAVWSIGVQAAPITEHRYNYNTESSIRDIMAAMAELPAEVLWDPGNGEWTDEGYPDIPDDESNWAKLRNNAVILREVGNAINLPGRVADHILPDENVEGVLAPAEIEELIRTRYAQWSAFSQSLEGLANQFIEAIDSRDKQRVIELGDEMNNICTACHTAFWYPQQQ